jgi:hypothetical protein
LDIVCNLGKIVYGKGYRATVDLYSGCDSDATSNKLRCRSDTIPKSLPFCRVATIVLAHLAKGNVSFCHHLASVVCRPLAFHILIFSSETSQPYEVKLSMEGSL